MTVILKDIQEISVKKVPKIETGHTVRVHQIIKEGEKQRIQIFEGLVIKTNSGYGADASFTVRKVVDGIGVEKIFPLYSPMIEKIEVKKKSKVRRSKLYYMRERSGKSARLKGSFVAPEEEIIEESEVNEAVEESAPEAEAAKDTKAEATPEAEVTPEAETAQAEEKTPEEQPAKEELKEEATEEPKAEEKPEKEEPPAEEPSK